MEQKYFSRFTILGVEVLGAKAGNRRRPRTSPRRKRQCESFFNKAKNGADFSHD